MPPTDDGGDDDDSAFAEAMRGARPLAPGRARVAGPPSSATPRRTRAATPAVSPFIVEHAGDSVAGRARDVAAKLLRELRGGAHAVDARLDLHGQSRAEALRALERFLIAAASRGARGLLVIHGRGQGSDTGAPILRPAVWEWLASAAAERCGVMAFASARPRDGGDGATMVLLRRSDR